MRVGHAVMDEVRVSSWNELNDALYAGTFDRRLGRYRSRFVFRGLASARYDLRTGLARLKGASVERHLLRDFRKYAGAAAPGDSIWNWLALAQHHGLPTRLLDWTYSPYVAMHFATNRPETFGLDGVIWCVDYARTNRYLPDALKEVLDQEDVGVFTADMLERVASTLTALDRLAPDLFVAFLEPPSLDERIVNQFALFSMLSSPTARLDHWLEDRPGLVRRIIVPSELKWEVRDKLDQANVTERVLFPGLDGLSLWLRRYYGPKTGELDKPDLMPPARPDRAPGARSPEEAPQGHARRARRPGAARVSSSRPVPRESRT